MSNKSIVWKLSHILPFKTTLSLPMLRSRRARHAADLGGDAAVLGRRRGLRPSGTEDQSGRAAADAGDKMVFELTKMGN